MRRRNFIALLGDAAVTWPLSARGQQGRRLPSIGVLGTEVSVWAPWTAGFVARLRALGWIEGRTIAIEYRWSEGRPERMAEIAAEFVRLESRRHCMGKNVNAAAASVTDQRVKKRRPEASATK